jgi:hypothetical protein
MRCRVRRDASRDFEKLLKRICWLGPLLGGSMFYALFLYFGKGVSSIFVVVLGFAAMFCAFNTLETFVLAGVSGGLIFLTHWKLYGIGYLILAGAISAIHGFFLFMHLLGLYDPEEKIIEKAGEKAEAAFQKDHPEAKFDFWQISEDDDEMVFHVRLEEKIIYYAVNPQTWITRIREKPPKSAVPD